MVGQRPIYQDIVCVKKFFSKSTLIPNESGCEGFVLMVVLVGVEVGCDVYQCGYGGGVRWF